MPNALHNLVVADSAPQNLASARKTLSDYNLQLYSDPYEAARYIVSPESWSEPPQGLLTGLLFPFRVETKSIEVVEAVQLHNIPSGVALAILAMVQSIPVLILRESPLVGDTVVVSNILEEGLNTLRLAGFYRELEASSNPEAKSGNRVLVSIRAENKFFLAKHRWDRHRQLLVE